MPISLQISNTNIICRNHFLIELLKIRNFSFHWWTSFLNWVNYTLIEFWTPKILLVLAWARPDNKEQNWWEIGQKQQPELRFSLRKSAIVSLKISKSSQNPLENICARAFFFFCRLRPATLLKKALIQVYFCEFWKISIAKNTFFTENLWSGSTDACEETCLIMDYCARLKKWKIS